MRKFREEYQKELKEMPLFQMDAEEVKEKGQHRKKSKSRKIIFAASAACVCLICGVGTVTAMNYGSSVIRTREHGFFFTNNSKAFEEESAEDNSKVTIAKVEPQEVQLRNKAEDNGIAALSETGAIVLESKKLEVKTYNSIEEFYQQENIAITMPDIEWLGEENEIENISIVVSKDNREVSFNVQFLDERIFSLKQLDNRGNDNYAAFYSYMGDAVNERSYCNPQGFEYKLFDSVEDGEVVSIHAGISVNGRDITIDFFDFEEETVKKVLKQLDLSIYL